MTALVLVVEDELDIARVLEGYLRQQGFRTERASDGASALRMIQIIKPDLVLLDVMLPGIDGLEVLRTVRKTDQTPVILLTARNEDIDRILGLELGADDYIAKPFHAREVMARVKAVLRRAEPKHSEAPAVIRLNFLEVNREAMVARVLATGEVLTLTLSEFRLLEYLAAWPDRVFTRTALLNEALSESDALERVVDSHLSSLRQKLELAGVPDLIHTVRGMGYRLSEPT